MRILACAVLLCSALPALAAEAVFAGGCFWCVEADFEKLDGVIEAESGYTGGPEPNPAYEDVAYGRTGHLEAVRVRYDPAVVSYQALLDHYWVNIDPTVDDRQFCDTGRHYRPAIFVADETQRSLAEKSLESHRARGKPAPIKVTIEPLGRFWSAEAYHQDYYLKNPVRYNFYRLSCRRDARLEELWGEAAGGK